MAYDLTTKPATRLVSIPAGGATSVKWFIEIECGILVGSFSANCRSVRVVTPRLAQFDDFSARPLRLVKWFIEIECDILAGSCRVDCRSIRAFTPRSARSTGLRPASGFAS